MGRTKGSKNKNTSTLPDYANLPAEDRVAVLANLIVDKIYEDLHGKQTILRQLQRDTNA